MLESIRLEVLKHVFEERKNFVFGMTLSLVFLVLLSLPFDGALHFALPAILAVFCLNPAHTVRKYDHVGANIIVEFLLLIPSVFFLLFTFEMWLRLVPALCVLLLSLISHAVLGRVLHTWPQMILSLLFGLMVLTSGIIPLEFSDLPLHWLASFNPLYYTTQGFLAIFSGLGKLTLPQAVLRQALLLAFYLTLWKALE